MTIGEKIRSCRKEKGLTQVELAKRLHTTKQTVGKYETGIITEIPISRIKEIAAILDCDPEYLCGWEKETPTEDSGERLTDAEKELLSCFRMLPEAGQRAILVQLEALAAAQRSV